MQPISIGKSNVGSECCDAPASLSVTAVDITPELYGRPRRQPDSLATDAALSALTSEIVTRPRFMLQCLVTLAQELCRADAAGISLLDGDVFRWEALAGTVAGSRFASQPRDASPSGVVIVRNATQLMHLPHRAFPDLKATPPIVEVLLVPFQVAGKAIGAVWVIAQSDSRRFDLEDERVVRTLAQSTAVGWQWWKAAVAAEASNRRKDEFLAALGHELRNPLTAMGTAIANLRHNSTAERDDRAILVSTLR